MSVSVEVQLYLLKQVAGHTFPKPAEHSLKEHYMFFFLMTQPGTHYVFFLFQKCTNFGSQNWSLNFSEFRAYQERYLL